MKIKRWLSLCLALCLMVAFLPATVSAADAPTSGTCGENLTWSFDEGTGTLTISGTGEMAHYDDPMMEGATNLAPWQDFREGIKAVVVGEGVTTIDGGAFALCSSLTSVTLPDSLTSIGGSAFLMCPITEIDLPEKLTTIGGGAFSSTNLVSIEIPDSVTSLGGYLFNHCAELTTVKLPKNLTEISDYLLYGCKVTELELPEGITYIGDYALPSLKSVTLPSTLTEMGDYVFSALESVTIPGGIKTIGSTFWGSDVTEVIISEGVEKISAWAFGTCGSLKKVVIPASVKTIGVRAFQHNANGAEYYFMGDAPACDVYSAVGGTSESFFNDVTGTAYYPAGNETWTEELMARYSSEAEITWVPYEVEEEPENPEESQKVETTPMYRLYNPYTHEHLLTGSEDEKDQLVNIGWSLDGVAWNSPASGDPVYRLYNPYDDWHTYSMSQEEIENLVSLGWRVDGAVCYSASKESGMPIYRLFNPYEQVNYHMLTASVEERDWLASLGWQPEGVAWYGMVK